MNDWHSLEKPVFKMEMEDALGTPLAKLIDSWMSRSLDIIQTVAPTAPLVAQTMQLLDQHYTNMFLLVVEGLRKKQDRPEQEIEQLLILREYNERMRYGVTSDLVTTTLRYRMKIMGQHRGGERLPRVTVDTCVGKQNVRSWTAEKNGDVITIREYLEKEGHYVDSVVGGPPFVAPRLDPVEFVELLIKDREREWEAKDKFDRDLVWLTPNVAGTREKLENHPFAIPEYRYRDKLPLLFNPEKAYKYSFNFAYRFSVMDEAVYEKYTTGSHSIPMVDSAVIYNTSDDKFAIVVASGQFTHRGKEMLVYSYENDALVQVISEDDFTSWVKCLAPDMCSSLDPLPAFGEEQRAQLLDKFKHVPVAMRELPYDLIPEDLNDRELITRFVTFEFHEPLLIMDRGLYLAKRYYLAKREENGNQLTSGGWLEKVYLDSTSPEQITRYSG